MKKTNIPFTIIALLLLTLPLKAQTVIRPYIAVNAGYTETKLDEGDGIEIKDNQAIYGAALGIQINNAWRVEAAWQDRGSISDTNSFTVLDTHIGPPAPGGSWQTTNMDIKSDVKTNLAMLNVYYDAYNTDTLKIYIGAGAGVAMWDAKFESRTYYEYSSHSIKETDPAVAVYAGLVLPFTDYLQLDLGAAFYHIFMASGDNAVAAKDVNNITPSISLRFLF